MRRAITHLSLTDFRNYDRFSLEPADGLTILVGPNGAGKTNVIEAIALLTRGESFRTSAWQDLVRWGADSTKASIEAHDERGVATDVSLTVAAGRRTYQLNGSVKRRVSDVAGKVPSVVFTPEDLRVVKDAAERRRKLADSLGAQLSATYASRVAEYDRILRQRNALLRSGEASDGELAPWTERLIETGVTLRQARLTLLESVSADLAQEYADLAAGDTIAIEYRVRDNEDARAEGLTEAEAAKRVMTAAQAKRAGEERARGTSLVGPHRDDIVFLLDGRDARPFASQGQQRTVALAWKLAEVGAIERATGTTPALLLDDVMSELDHERRQRLADAVAARTQTFVTTTNLGYFEDDFVASAKVVSLG